MMTGGDGTAYMGEKKEPEMPKFDNTDNPSFKKNKVDPALNKKGGSDFIDYTKSKNTFKTFTKRGGISGFVNRRFGVGATKFKKPILSAKGLGKAALTIAKANPKTTAAVAVGAAVLPPIINKAKQIIKQRSDAKIDKDVEKYVSDRQLKGGPKKVNYKGTNVVPPFRNKEGGIVKRSGESYKQYTPSRFTGSPFKASPLNKNKNIYGLGEKMDLKKADMGEVIKDFYKSDAPQFKGKNKKERRDMAIAAKLEADGKSLKDEYLPEILDKKDVPHVKKLVKKLRDGSKTHAKQADELEVALKTEEKVDEAILPALMLAAKIGGGIMLAKKILDRKKKKKQEIIVRNEETAIESELIIQDWNKDDIKFTEIETVDIIKAKPLKESMTDKEFMKTDIEMKNNAAAGVAVSQEKQNDYVKEVNRRFKLNQKKVVGGEQEFKTKETKIEHYNWRDELDEDWQKVNRKDKTDGLSKKAVKAYRRENPGSKLQTAVTTKPSKLKKGSKSAKRRLSFCRRMKGMKKKLTSAKTRRDPDSRINKALRRWNC